MAFNPFSIDLPITDVVQDIKASLSNNNTLIIKAPPGAGKSTILPLALMEEPWLEGKKILILEPRRLATKSIAMRMSQLLEQNVGEEVGYMIRFENRTSANTKIKVLTEGILTRLIHKDNALEDVGLVIFDEFHERNIHADVAMALCREVQQVLRPDLRILVMSATIDMPQLSKLLDAPVIESLGRQYPVEVKYWGDHDEAIIVETVNQAVVKAAQDYMGDILVFLPGQAQILKCNDFLRRALPHFAIHPLYGQLPFAKQQSAILPDNQGRRKVVLATSIAETSLTIEGVSLVIDSGYGRTSRFDPRSGLSRLETVQVTQDAADQRAGRAGRLGPGHCIRLWSQATHEKLQAYRTPEILEADLASLVLDLVAWNIHNYQKMAWLTVPPQGAFSQAVDLLISLQAIENGKLTEHGKQLQELPTHPRIGHMLIRAQEQGNPALATDIAAILEEKDPMDKEAGADINMRIEKLRRLRRDQNVHGRFRKIETVAAQYRKMLDISVSNEIIDPYETGILLAYAYPERIACARPGNNAQFQLSNGRFAMLGHRDDLAHEPWMAVANMDARDGMGKIFLASPLNPRDLAPMVEERELVLWDTKKGGLQANKVLRIGNIILQSKPLSIVDPEEAKKVILQAIKTEGERLLDFNQDVNQWQNRVLSLAAWNEMEDWPKVDTPTLLANAEDWLMPYLDQVKKTEDLRKLNLKQILNQHLDWEKQQILAELAPESLEVPSGSKIKLEYFSGGEPPVLAVRLQELFGLLETPTINRGKNKVLIHLLSPGFKPVQVTADLKSFWKNTYQEVKKELKRRYPKHSWPEDPYKAEPLRGVRKPRT